MYRILIVEDSATQSDIIKNSILTELDVELLFAKDAFSAYAIMNVYPELSAIVLDYQLPYVNGLKFMEKLRTEERFKDIAVIISSVSEDATECFKANAAEFLQKPYSAAEICKAIKLHAKEI